MHTWFAEIEDFMKSVHVCVCACVCVFTYLSLPICTHMKEDFKWWKEPVSASTFAPLLFNGLKYGCGKSLQTTLRLGFIGITQVKNNGKGQTGYQQ